MRRTVRVRLRLPRARATERPVACGPESERVLAAAPERVAAAGPATVFDVLGVGRLWNGGRLLAVGFGGTKADGRAAAATAAAAVRYPREPAPWADARVVRAGGGAGVPAGAARAAAAAVCERVLTPGDSPRPLPLPARAARPLPRVSMRFAHKREPACLGSANENEVRTSRALTHTRTNDRRAGADRRRGSGRLRRERNECRRKGRRKRWPASALCSAEREIAPATPVASARLSYRLVI